MNLSYLAVLIIILFIIFYTATHHVAASCASIRLGTPTHILDLYKPTPIQAYTNLRLFWAYTNIPLFQAYRKLLLFQAYTNHRLQFKPIKLRLFVCTVHPFNSPQVLQHVSTARNYSTKQHAPVTEQHIQCIYICFVFFVSTLFQRRTSLANLHLTLTKYRRFSRSQSRDSSEKCFGKSFFSL